MAPAVGIDLGTTYSCVGVFREDRCEIIANDQGNRTTPSFVAFTDTERLIGDAAKNQVAMNPHNTVFDAKRLIGRKFADSEVQADMKHFPFKIVDKGGKPNIEVEFKGDATVLLPPGGTVFPPDDTGTAAGVLEASMTSPFAYTIGAGHASGTITAVVYREAVTKTIDFYFQVVNSALSNLAITRAEFSSFLGFTTEVATRTDGATLGGGLVNGSKPPLTADRSNDAKVVGFSFFPPTAANLMPGQASLVLVVKTNATNFASGGNASVIGGGVATVGSFLEATGVPEPASMALIGAGMLALGLLRKFRPV